MDGLTAKQKRFVDEYLIDCNATQAAIRAGYSPKTANIQAAKLMRNKSISDYINSELEKIRSGKIASAEEVLEYLTSVLRGEQKEQALIFTEKGKQEIVEIALPARDRIRAAELIGKRYGLFRDNVNLGESRIIIMTDVPEDW